MIRSLKKTRMKKRPRRGDNPQLRHEWAMEHLACAACWTMWPAFGIIEVHHLLGGKWRRPDRRWNMLALCHECHTRLQDGLGNLAVCLLLKKESNIEDYSRRSMQAWMKRFGTQRLIETARVLPGWIKDKRVGQSHAAGHGGE